MTPITETRTRSLYGDLDSFRSNSLKPPVLPPQGKTLHGAPSGRNTGDPFKRAVRLQTIMDGLADVSKSQWRRA